MVTQVQLNMQVNIKENVKINKFTLSDVYYVSNIKINLISTHSIIKKMEAPS